MAPSGPREQLVLLAKQQYRAYKDAASSLSSQAFASASTAIYGDSTYQASKSVSSIIAQATKEAARALDNADDYVYSKWDNSQLEDYLRTKGVLKGQVETNRQAFLAKMEDAYAKVANPIWEAWSDTYIVRY